MTYLLLVLLIILLLFNLKLNRNDIIAPAVLFTFSFVISAFFAALYVGKWELFLHKNTFYVIIFGVLEFSVVCAFIHFIGTFFRHSSYLREAWRPKIITISRIKLLIFAAFEILTIFYSIYAVVKLYHGSLLHFTDSINQYRNQNLFGNEKLSLPRMVTYLRLSVEAGGYWFGYILVNNYFLTKKINVYLLMVVMLSAISSYIMGGRTGMINIIVALGCSWFIISNKSRNFRNLLKFKTLVSILLIGIIVLSCFESLAFLIGRGGYEGASGLDYLAIYIGAPIKNLDTFLQGNIYVNNIFESQTFINLMNGIGPKFHLIQHSIMLDLPFQRVGIYSLGNVYTTFYAFIYDFGYNGVWILVLIMAIISQMVYETVRSSYKVTSPAYSSLVYSYIATALVMSFFSNRFYEQIFNLSFTKIIIIWMLFKLIFIKVVFDRKEIK